MGKLWHEFLLDKYLKIRYALIFAIATIGLVLRFFIYPHYAAQWHWSLFFIQITSLTVVWEFIRLIHNYLNIVLPFEEKMVLRILIQLIISLFVSSLVSILVLKISAHYAPWEISDPVRVLFSMASVLFLLVINFSYVATYFFEQWKKSLVVAVALEREAAQVQYENLKNQLNPHFLFNSISSLHSLIYENQELAASFLLQLSKVYRYVLQYKDSDSVSVGTEVEFIGHYLSLLKTRFPDSFMCHIQLEEWHLNQKIVPVTLQILIENAIKHTKMSEEEPLTVRIFADDTYIWVTNPNRKKSQVEFSNGLGLSQLQRMYGLLSPTPLEYGVENALFYVKVPFIK